MATNYPFTGCKNDGTEYSSGGNSRDLGAANNVGVGRPNSTASGHGPLHTNDYTSATNFNRPMYGLSAAFRVADLGVGVTVSKTTLTVTEEDATGDSYTVVLDSQPTNNVTVTVAGHSITDVTLTPSSAALAFTTMNWDTPQTVTVKAGNDSVTLTHSATSPDANYDEITIASVTVTVNDTDTDQVVGLMVKAGDTKLTVNLTAVYTATGYKVQWKSGSLDYNTGDRQFTVSSGSTTSHTIPNLTNGTEYTIRVIAARTGANDGPPSEEERGTPTGATTVPSAPTGLTANADGTAEIDLSWTAPSFFGGSPLTGYKIEVSPNGNSSWSNLVGNTGNTNITYSHTGLNPGTTRYYRVSAINSDGAGDASDPANATTDNSVGTGAASNVANATINDDGMLTVTFDD